MTRILFRVDAGQILHVAMGHAFRCLALAEEMKFYGAESLFLMREEQAGNDFIRRRDFQVTVLSESASAHEELAAMQALKPDVVVFDLLQTPEGITQQLQQMGVIVVILDDLGQKTLRADLLVNGSLIQSNHVYAGEIGRQLLGPRYAILGSDFDKKRNSRAKTGPVKEILVTMGGADPRGFTPIVANSLVENGIGEHITVVQGPAFAKATVVENAHFRMKTQVRVQENVPDLSILMVAADLVVSAAGRTAYELAVTGTPCVLVPTAAHEVDVAEALVAVGAAQAVSSAEEDCLRRELVGLVATACDPNIRIGMAKAGRRFIDGGGRQRVAKAINDLGRSRARNGWGKD